MKPSDPIFEVFSEGMEQAAPEILRYSDAAATINKIVDWATEDCQTLALPRIKQVRFAVQRQLNQAGVTFPGGTIYQTPAYDRFNPHAEEESPGMDYETRIAVVAGDKKDGFFDKLLDKLDGVDSKSSSTAIIHMTVPVTSPPVYGIEAVNFVVVKAKSNDSFWYTLAKNENLGKVFAVEALQSEHGDMRDSFGPIDRLPIKAVPASLELRALMLEELKKAAQILVKDKEPTPTTSQKVREKATSVGNLVMSKIRTTASKP